MHVAQEGEGCIHVVNNGAGNMRELHVPQCMQSARLQVKGMSGQKAAYVIKGTGKRPGSKYGVAKSGVGKSQRCSNAGEPVPGNNQCNNQSQNPNNKGSKGVKGIRR